MKKIFLLGFLFSCFLTEAQQQVTGEVRDASNGELLPYVNVLIKDSEGGTTTDLEGRYELTVNQDDVLIFSYLGFLTQEMPVNNRNIINISLDLDIAYLDDVVVVGYGTVRKSDLTGSVTSVDAEDLRNVPVTSFEQALQGRAAGVQVTQTTGSPGGGTNIRIRGTSSVNASSEPLYVIDGMLINSDSNEMSLAGRGPRIGALSTINPNDIESIEVLKDASATAIYGSRGANGVILITTKRGKAGVSTVSLESYYGVQEVANKLDLLNATEFAELVNEANINAGRVPIYANPSRFGEGTDWQEELFQMAPISNHQVSFAGGNEKTRYALTGGYFSQDGVVVGSDFERYSFRINLDTEMNDRLRLETNVSYNRLSSNGVLTGPGNIVPGVITSALQFNPMQPVYDPSVEGGYTFEHNRKSGIGNPVAEALEYESNTLTSRIMGNVAANYEIIEGLDFKTSFGIDGLTSKNNSFGPNFLKRTESSNGEAMVSTLQAMTWLNTNTLSYNREFNENHSLNAMAGLELQSFHNESLIGFALDFPDSRTGWHNLGAAENPQNPGNSEMDWSMLSYFGRLNYSLNNKYLFTVSGRVDGSSKFAEGNKYGFFPSGAFAWKVSEESFLQEVDIIHNLKLRASYGVTGNQSIPPYMSLALVGPVGEGVFTDGLESEVFRGQQPLSFPNQDLKWETTEQANLGVDLALWKGRFRFTGELYQKKTSDLLLNTPIPRSSGFTQTLLNVGNVQNRGVDLEFTTVNIEGAFRWTSSLNLSLNRNKITNLAREEDILLGGGNILREGYPIGTFFGYVFDGIYQTDAEAESSAVLIGHNPAAGDRRYLDISGPDGNPDGLINEYDRTIIGSAQPDFTWGLRNELSYGNFNLSFFFQGSQGNEMVNMNLLNLENVNGQQNVLAEAGLNRWTPENPNNRYARALATAADANVFSSRIVEDASYVRLKNVTLSYNIPSSLLERVGMSNVRIYTSGTNLLTLTDYSGYDPEGNAYGGTTNIVGVDDGNYPQARVYTLGLNIGF